MDGALIMVAFPGMVLGWDLLWRGSAGAHLEPSPLLTVVLARVQDVAGMLVGAAAVVLLAASFHRTAPPRLVTSLVGVIACVGAVVCGSTVVVMNFSDAPSAAEMAAANPYIVAGVPRERSWCSRSVMWSAVRTLRVARSHLTRETRTPRVRFRVMVVA